ncbi:MAG: UvrD-helicase domain-containing protein [Verrucomicrobiota bacterium]
MRLEDLNPAQRLAVTTTQGPVLILAGAGTGKTRVITTRICHLLKKGVRPEQILAVTFTNKAAKEMAERVEHMTPKGTVKKLTISTFHSLCVKILRRDIERLGYKKNFAIYTGGEQMSLVRRIIVKKAGKGEKLDPDAAISLISRQRNKGIPAAEQEDALVNVVMREYAHQLKLLNAVDFDDLLILAEKVLKEFPDVRQAWQGRYEYVMVDEFQDTNKLQMDLIRHLVGPHMNVCVVGDDDQSIYGWRGAEIANILQFERFFPNPSIVKLEENYRSTDVILNTANGLIRNNRDRREKRLWSAKKSAEPVRLISMPGEQEEADFVVEDLMVTKERDNLKHDDFAILFRTNSQTRVFEEGMRKNKIPYRIIGGRSFFDRREVKDVLAYLAVLVNPDDDINLLRIVNTPPRGLSDTVVECATLMSQERKESVFKTLASDAFHATLSKRAAGAAQEFAAFVAKWQDALAGEYPTIAEMTTAMLESIEYLPWLRRSCKDEEEAMKRDNGIRELLESVRTRPVRDETELIDFLGSICLDDDRDSAKDDLEKQQGVTLITLHASKGLEFPHVYLPGLEEGILPHKRSVDEGTTAEERRLLYVGITRARERLTLTWCAARVKWGDRLPSQGSSFLKELDPQCVQRSSWQELRNRPVSLDEAKSRFSAMRQMLGG